MESPSLRHLGTSPDSGWDVYFLGVQTPVALPSALSVPSEHFVCLLSWNAQRVPVETISAVAERLLGLGCVYICCRGRDCERVHDVIDEVLVGDGNANVAWLDVMTTWHDNEALEDNLDPGDSYKKEDLLK